MAAITSGVTRRTPLRAPPWTVLKAIAETSAASFRQPDSGSVSCARQRRTASAWSATRSVRSCRRWPICSVQRLSGDPIRSMPPRASCRPASMSNSRCLKLVEPRLATSIFMESLRRSALHLPWQSSCGIDAEVDRDILRRCGWAEVQADCFAFGNRLRIICRPHSLLIRATGFPVPPGESLHHNASAGPEGTLEHNLRRRDVAALRLLNQPSRRWP